MSHASEIESGDDAFLRLELLKAQGKKHDVIALWKEIARGTRLVVLTDEETENDAQPTDPGDTQ